MLMRGFHVTAALLLGSPGPASTMSCRASLPGLGRSSGSIGIGTPGSSAFRILYRSTGARRKADCRLGRRHPAQGAYPAD